MAQLAIKGHPIRGKEVISLLEMLGGKNDNSRSGGFLNTIYFINKNGYIENCDKMHPLDYLQLTLEEFFERFPYKIGDKVLVYDNNLNAKITETITRMRWHSENNCILYDANVYHNLRTKDLQPYKEETMEKEISGAILDRFICLEGYDFYDDKGNIINTKEITMKKKQPEYPTTYTECCILLNHVSVDEVKGYKDYLIENFQILLVCRDAYWKIAGDWKPNFNDNEGKYVIAYCYGKVYTTMTTNYNRILVFPTEEMRDAFYENFKELIEQCKELL